MKTLISMAIAIIVLAGCAGTPTVQQGPNAEVTYDGLNRVDGTMADNVWLLPSIDLSKYDKIMMESAGIQYRHVKDPGHYDRTADEFPMDEEQKQKFQAAVREALTDELREIENYTFTDAPGPGVLKVTIGLMDVVSHIPEERPGRDDFYIRELGSAVLVMELSDSQTNRALARVVDGATVEPVMAQKSNPVTNTSEVKREIRRWGSRIRNSLDELHALGCFVCSNPGNVQ